MLSALMKSTFQRKEQKQMKQVERTKTSLRLPVDLLKAAKIRAVETDMDLQDLVADALRLYLQQRGGAR
jgi:hypothetical protein